MSKNEEAGYKAVENEMVGLWKKANRAKRSELLSFFNHRILFLQHERHVHLLVTLFFSGAALFLGWAAPASGSWSLPAIFLIVLITLLFYIGHYYTLENTCQRWQRLSLRLERELLDIKSK